MEKKININFLTETAKKEFIKLYGENPTEDDIFWFTKFKCDLPFDKIDDIVFEVIENIKEIKDFWFNISFREVYAVEREEDVIYILYFHFSNEHFDYLPGDTDTTEAGIKRMNEKFKFKDIGKIKVECGRTLETIIKIKRGV